MSKATIIFPHQLFNELPFDDKQVPVYLVEEELFFSQYSFHKVKISFHRASMKYYEDHLKSEGWSVNYIDSQEEISSIKKLISNLGEEGVKEIHFINPVDDWLERRLKAASESSEIQLKEYETPMFLNSEMDLSKFFKSSKKKFFQTKFYIEERKDRGILIDDEGKAKGGQWSFDKENRKKYPKKKEPPKVNYPETNAYWTEAVDYVNEFYANNPGEISKEQFYPVTPKEGKKWFEDFLNHRFREFGAYEDAMVKGENILHHSLLSPLLNNGLLTPHEVLEESLAFAKESKNDIPINSLEGFVRQIMGWREFIRGIYRAKGVEERTKNFWNFKRKMPSSFYDGTTGITPFDEVIEKVNKNAYCHHIERLMVLGNFMVLCEIDPDEVYKWFMELFIDAYDWVMVPNVYGMSQFADGGLMSTKPYISGSNYLMKMGDFENGDWQDTWDALFWRFMHVHRDFFTSNPRLGMLIGNFDKMDSQKREKYLNDAEQYLNSLK